MMFISIIVPFYNVEPYIEKCIRSLYNQDIPHDEYEVICIDDSSPDGSRAIVEDLQKEYSTLRLICHSENKRQGGARNTGLKSAKGKYVWFVDSDDYVLPNVLSTIVQTAEKDELDVLQFTANTTTLPENAGVMSGVEYALMDDDWSSRLPLMWRTVFLRSFLQKNDLSFVEYVQFEDTDFALRAYLAANRVRCVNYPAYVYCVHPESTVHRANSPIKIFEQVLLLNRTSKILEQSMDARYEDLLKRYVKSELSILGMQVNQLSFKDRLIYTKMVNALSLRWFCKYTSTRNALRLKYGLCL